MSAAFITFTPEAQDHIASFFDDTGTPLGLSLVWGTKITSKDERVVLHDRDWSIALSRDAPTDDSVALCIRDRTVHMRLSSFQQLVGRTVYLSHGHSSDRSVTCGDLLKVS
jgi:hypothetical protein